MINGPFALADLIRSKRIRKYIGRHICLAGFTPNMKSSEKVNYRDKAFKDGNIYLRNCIEMSPPSQEAPHGIYIYHVKRVRGGRTAVTVIIYDLLRYLP